ncbi:MAG: PBP1A family penicillin-binding protein [Vampirovibrionales bacterium]|nr:PBP1A family penicillin-binding protein [Vampirovibrionales bacterium]
MGLLFKFLAGVLALLGGVFFFNKDAIVTGVTQPFTLPDVAPLVAESALLAPPVSSSRILASDGSIILANGQFKHTSVKLNQVSPEFISALIATEDRRFYDHHGVDPLGVIRAAFVNLTAGNVREGASTLTQQLVRQYLLSNERTFTRKIKEMLLAWRVEDKLSKEQILERYVNSVYFGHGAYGIHAASAIYFSKPPGQLTQSEAAVLAGLPQAPSRYDPIINPDLALERRNDVLKNLVEAGYLKPEQLDWYAKQPLNLHAQTALSAAGNKTPYFNQYIMAWVQRTFGLSEGEFWSQGLQVHTTLDLRAQRLAESALINTAAAFGRRGGNKQAAMTVLDPRSGAILAYVGGLGFENSQFDRVTQAKRPPGSLFKVFTYTTAIDSGVLPGAVYTDEPITFDKWQPKNYDGKHYGAMPLTQALAQSNNIVAVKLIQELGADRVASMANRMGIESSLPRNLSLTLGACDVNLLEIVSAFGTLANQGVQARPYAVARLTNAQGQVLYEAHQNLVSAISSKTAQTMVNMMALVVSKGTGRAANIDRPVAGKTGTSDDHRDAWFIGFTPSLVAGVWMGNDDNSPMPKGTSGGGMPAVVFARFMNSYLAGKPVEAFDTSLAESLDDVPAEIPDPEQDSLQDTSEDPLEPLESDEMAAPELDEFGAGGTALRRRDRFSEDAPNSSSDEASSNESDASAEPLKKEATIEPLPVPMPPANVPRPLRPSGPPPAPPVPVTPQATEI